MSTPALLTGSPVTPSRVIDAKTASVAGLGEVLKDLISRSGIFHSEAQVKAAHDAVDAFKRAFSTGDPEVRDEHRATVSVPVDVPSITTAPAGGAPVIDYNALARAIVAVQQGASTP